MIVGIAIIAAVAVVAVVTVETAGAGTAIVSVAVGAAKGAALGAMSGAASGAVTGAVGHCLMTGSWNGVGEAALNGMGNGWLSGSISGAVVGGIGSYASYKDFGIEKIGRLQAKGRNEGYVGVKYHFNRVASHNKRVVHSFELHSPHGSKNPHHYWHWQLNRWSKNKSKAIQHWRLWGKKV